MSTNASFNEDKMEKNGSLVTKDVIPATADVVAYIDPAEERKLLWKVDLVLISLLGYLYLLCFLDRSNIGNANIAGLSEDLGLVNNQFGICVSVVYATYVSFEPVWANLLKIVGAKNLMTLSTILWGTITIGTAFVNNFHQLVACRVLLGAAEAGLFPCLNLYLAMTYRPEELNRRMSFIFVAAALSGAFGGLLAYGLTQIEGGPLQRWQYLYLVEGLMSLLAAPLVFFILPNSLDRACWLTARERELCVVRYDINRRNYNPDDKFSWHAVKLAVTDWITWSAAVNQFAVDLTLYGLTTFMPTIIRGLGLTRTTVSAQLLTVPVYVVAALSYVVGARYSDKYRCRSIPIMTYSAIALVGYIILAASDSVKVRFFGVFVVAMSLYGGVATNVVWTNSLCAGHFRRATSIGLMQLVGNSSGACIGFIFSAQTAPRYARGIYIAMGFSVLSIVVTIGQALALKRINAKRAALVAAGAPDEPEKGSDNAHFRYML